VPPAAAIDRIDASGSRVPAEGRRDGIGRGLALSLLLHGLVALLIVLGLSGLMQPAIAPPLQLVPVDLVQLGAKTASPPRQQTAAVPQDPAPETSPLAPADPVPLPQTPPPRPELKRPEIKEGPLADPLATLNLEIKPDLPQGKQGPKSQPPAAKPPPKPKPPLDDLNARLESLARQQQQQAMTPPSPRQQEGAGASNVAASSEGAAAGLQATYSAKDFIRAQIARHWYLDRGVTGSGDFTVAIHLVLTRAGGVETAEIVDAQSYIGDDAYREVANSLRNAVRLSAPFVLPPGRFAEIHDMVLTFSPRDLMR
jgi:hypothetical protein